MHDFCVPVYMREHLPAQVTTATYVLFPRIGVDFDSNEPPELLMQIARVVFSDSAALR
jgi:hypothetical protein